MERTSLCGACTHFEVVPASLAVDPACRSEDDADRLCARHRAFATEGLCVLCGRRMPWMSPWPNSAFGSCEPCYRVAFGDAAADQAEKVLPGRDRPPGR